MITLIPFAQSCVFCIAIVGSKSNRIPAAATDHNARRLDCEPDGNGNLMLDTSETQNS